MTSEGGRLSTPWTPVHVILYTWHLPVLAGLLLYGAATEITTAVGWRIAAAVSAIFLLAVWVRMSTSFRHIAAQKDGIDIQGFGDRCHVPYYMIERVRHSYYMLSGWPGRLGGCIVLTLRQGSSCSRRRIRFWPLFRRKNWIAGINPLDYLTRKVAREKFLAGEGDVRDANQPPPPPLPQ